MKTIADIPDVIAKGRNNGAMPTWETRLKPAQILVTAAYVATLRGGNEQGNPPQGKVIPAWSAGAAAAPAVVPTVSAAPAK
ncbi:MAG: hypothetical protein QM770_14915 [Tepidisphaeraceae bacterium]